MTQIVPENGERGETSPVADDQVFADLFAAHQASIHRLAVLLSGDRFVAEEITAEVFARVLPRWRRGQVSDPVLYLRRAVVNEVRSRFRRRSNERRALTRHSSQTRPIGNGDQAGAVSEPLIAALQLLPPRQRTVVVLRFHDDLSVAEVAHIVGAPVGTVKTQTRRALSALRIVLEDTT